MNAIVEAFLASLDDDALQHLATLLAPRLADRPERERPWLNAEQAASYLACTPDRLYDLVQLRKIPVSRDGRRLLFRRDDLDAYLST